MKEGIVSRSEDPETGAVSIEAHSATGHTLHLTMCPEELVEWTPPHARAEAVSTGSVENEGQVIESNQEAEAPRIATFKHVDGWYIEQ